MSRFIPHHTPRTPMLYHAIPFAAEGDALRTSERWGMEILPAEREKLGIGPHEHPPLLFAATNFNKALAYTIGKGEGRLCCGTIESADAEILITGDRDNFMTKPQQGTIYSFPDNGFVNLPNAQHQSASLNPMPFSQTNVALQVNSIEDVMRAGLQIFTFKEDAKAVYQDKDAIAVSDAKTPEETVERLSALIAAGKVVWENQARGINPNPLLAAQLGVKLPAPATAPPPRRPPPPRL